MSKYLKSALFGIFRIMAYFSQAVKTLIIHPKDPTTDVLTGIYSGINNKTVINVERVNLVDNLNLRIALEVAEDDNRVEIANLIRERINQG